MRASAKLSHAGWQAGGRCAKLKHREADDFAARLPGGRPALVEWRRFATFAAAIRLIGTKEALHLDGS
jgi:hypothetical protein